MPIIVSLSHCSSLTDLSLYDVPYALRNMIISSVLICVKTCFVFSPYLCDFLPRFLTFKIFVKCTLLSSLRRWSPWAVRGWPQGLLPSAAAVQHLSSGSELKVSIVLNRAFVNKLYNNHFVRPTWTVCVTSGLFRTSYEFERSVYDLN